MAKKTTPKKTASTKKTTARKTSSKKSKSSRASKSSKKVNKKTARQKVVAKKSASKKTAAKKKPRVKKTPAKKTTAKKKTVAKKTKATKATKTARTGGTKKTSKKLVKKKTTKRPSSKKKLTKKASHSAARNKATTKAAAKKATTKKATTKKTAASKASGKRSFAQAVQIDKSPKTSKPGKRNAASSKRASLALGRASYGTSATAATTVGDAVNLDELSQSQLKRAKAGLKRKDLLFFRDELLDRRAEILGDVAHLDQVRNDSNGDLSNVPLHMADVGSENYDREFNLGLLESEKKLLREIDEALLRIANGTYGVCHVTGQPIERIRLEIKPWAKYGIEIARERERRGMSS